MRPRVADGLLVVLGAPNFSDGSLSSIARSRAHRVVQAYEARRQLITATGGFGDHFNVSSRPHFEYVYEFLRAHGVIDSDILPGLGSSNTWEDVTMTVARAAELRVTSLRVVTSDFHCERVALLFNRHAPALDVEVIGAETTVNAEKLEALRAHETRATASIEEHQCT